VRIIGSESATTVNKELGIRRVFGSLPSALFVLDSETARDGLQQFTFTGAGRGHGVGLCQNGARGMAQLGMIYSEVLGHYFGKADLLRYR
jgi:SpoIID/LytB domain protein